ncbi:MAG: hypothetical protein A2486_14830 [Burkholderiales bacterium RIFOXYC12_FULL_65_23]|jgi:Na+/glutamate symporter|uniref:DUF4337 domain-containing protein n=1 Tax=Malikia spinosa TaxID=86180 RepID=UPI0008C18BC8|nr:MAG: hypothetical protein A2486_14830 [Burkholderiales bacterium RIFOXYC12_FULL_65_23]
MSSNGFHVHGPHDHEVEHAVKHGGDSLTAQIAMFTAVIATVGAILGYMGGATQANAGLYKNNAAIKKTEAANQWNYYQAKSNKQNLAELSLEIVSGSRREFYQSEIERYKSEKVEIKAKAEQLETEAGDWEGRSEQQMHQHHRYAQATTAIQVSVAIAAIVLLTRRNWLKTVMYGMGGVGLVIGGMAALHI